jgi:hypothetical protein
MRKSCKSGIFFEGKPVHFNSDNYPCIWNSETKKISTIHKYVWERANGNIPVGLTINHIDGNKMNWDLTNLELLTQKENVRHAWKIGLCKPKKGQNHGRAILDDIKVLTILTMPKRKPNGHRPGWSHIELGKIFKVSTTRISEIRAGREWKHIHKLLNDSTIPGV